jgi:hypothetical protein
VNEYKELKAKLKQDMTAEIIGGYKPKPRIRYNLADQ